MLTRMMFIIIVQLIRRVPLSFSRLNHHLPCEWMFLIDRILIVGVHGVGDWIPFVFQGAEGAFTCDKVESGSVDSFRSLDRKVLIQHEDFVEFGLLQSACASSWNG